MTPSFAAYDSDVTTDEGETQKPIEISDDETQNQAASDSQNVRQGLVRRQTEPFEVNVKLSSYDLIGSISDDSQSLLDDSLSSPKKVVCDRAHVRTVEKRKVKGSQVVPSTSTDSMPSASKKERPSVSQKPGKEEDITSPKQDFAAEVLKRMDTMNEKMDSMQEKLEAWMSKVDGRLSRVESKISKIEKKLSTNQDMSPTAQLIDDL